MQVGTQRLMVQVHHIQNDDLKALTVSADADYLCNVEPTDKNNQVTLTFDSTGCDGAVSPASITVVKETLFTHIKCRLIQQKLQQQATNTHFKYEGLSQSNAKFNAPFELNGK